ncbi:MAG TPA: P-loop-containing protein [Aggregatilinea sp.]|uniref:P-loop-containing protein n=1 Tax=Aggregatilinea sp. TaxID=2806333 RepID=UPI002CF808D2|nr:P-loop-containing protein [Aggregatilinea sp.]HML21825.1 P-loop-containing protein [Aggregatilinea sp.]
MWSIMRTLGPGKQFAFGRTLRGIRYDASRMFVLGVYDGSPFSGTDKLAMNVQPSAELFIKALNNRSDYAGWTVLFEGDRLFNPKFLRLALDIDPHAVLVLLTVDESTLSARHVDRNDKQSESWLRGRKTKYRQIQKAFPEITVHTNRDPADAARLMRWIEEARTHDR